MDGRREAYRRFAKSLLKSALKDGGFGFVNTMTGKLALAMLDDDRDIIAEFRRPREQKKVKRRARLSRSFRGL